MRRGKQISQGAHSSLAVILNMMKKTIVEKSINYTLDFDKDSYLDLWLNGKFTKITVSCKDEEELLELYNKSIEMNIPCVLITDAGLTEFHGVPTNTCIAIGPFYNDDIDKITKNLPLL